MNKQKKRYEDYNQILDRKMEKTSKRSRKSNEPVFSRRRKAKIIFNIVMIGAVLVMLVVGTAYQAQLNYNITNTQKEIDGKQAEINGIYSTIQASARLDEIEQKAINELSMVYPDDSQVVQLDSRIPEKKDFASKLKEIALFKENK